MRITVPPPGARADLDGLDLSDPAMYTDRDPHLVWQTLRADHPVFWNQRSGTGFWAVTRHADVRRVLHDHQSFTSERGTALDVLGAPDPAAGIMMHATDPPCHERIRRPLEQPLTAAAVPQYAGPVRALVRQALAPARDATGQDATGWDAAAAVTRLPVAVMARLMDLPGADVELLQRAAYASVAPTDPQYRTGSRYQTLHWAHSTIVEYFTRWVRKRRASPAGDLLSHLITMDVGGRSLTEEEVVVNCFSLLVGGVVTTGQAVTATLAAWLGPDGGDRGRVPAAAPASLVEEALRWSSPTTHFVRHATRDVLLHDVQIRAGEPVAAWIASANRDERVFGRPYTFDPARQPNRHLAFGTGPHRCVGRQLARLVLRETFAELTRTVDRFELVGPPVHLASNLIAGMVRLPVRIRPRLGGPG